MWRTFAGQVREEQQSVAPGGYKGRLARQSLIRLFVIAILA
jgi:hypothetical protein